MTREEAILWMQVLKHAQINWAGEQAEDEDIIARCEEAEQDAFDMAIEALQAESTNGRQIDADALKNYLLLLTEPKQDNFGDWGALVTIRIDKLIEIIDNAQTVQADRPHGEWVDIMNHESVCKEWECSMCGSWNFEKTDFCPHCGAKMKGGDGE